MKHLLIGIAAVAFVGASAASAQGNGRGQGNERAEQARSGGAAANRGGPSMQDAARAERGNPDQTRGNPNQARGNENPGRGNDNPGRSAGTPDRGAGNAPQSAGAQGRGNSGAAPGNANRPVQAVRADVDRGPPGGEIGRRDGRLLDDGRRIFQAREAQRWWVDDGPRGLINGCPPGLAQKRNGCRPPGLARQEDRYRYRSYRPDWWGLGTLGLGDGRYFYEDGYLLRFNGDRLMGYVPLLGGALAIGRPWPDYYAPRPVPAYYADYYRLGPAGGYRYADNVLYRVNPETAAITSIAALLTGNDIRVGQPMPMGYDVYNVPYGYRSQYVDGPDAWYRYSDGYVYQVDPETRLVAAAIELLAS